MDPDSKVELCSIEGREREQHLLRRSTPAMEKANEHTYGPARSGDQVLPSMQIDSGYISRHFITDRRNRVAELVDPYVLLHEEKLSDLGSMLPLLEAVIASGKPLLIIAEDVNGELLQALIVNNQRGPLRAAAVAIPGPAEERQVILDQIAEFTGTKVYSDDLGWRLERIKLDWLGKAQKVIVERDRINIYVGSGTRISDRNAVPITTSVRPTPETNCVAKVRSGSDWTGTPGPSRLTVPNIPGGGGKKRAEAIAAMVGAVEQQQLTFEELQCMRQKELHQLYPTAGRTLLAECREAALKELTARGFPTKADITPTNDK